MLLLMSLCACGDGAPIKPFAIRYNGQIVSVYSTKSQIEGILGAPVGIDDRNSNAQLVKYYYLGGKDMVVFSKDSIFAIYIYDDKMDFGGLKVGDSLSKAQKYLDNCLGSSNGSGDGRYSCSIVQGEPQKLGYAVVNGVNETEAMIVSFEIKNNKIVNITVLKKVGEDKIE